MTMAVTFAVWKISNYQTPRNSAWYVSVCHKPVMYGNGWMVRLRFLHTDHTRLVLHCFNRIRVSPSIWVIPSGSLTRTLSLKDFLCFFVTACWPSEVLSRSFDYDRRKFIVGCVAQWLERRSLTGELSCPTLDLQLVGDHLCGVSRPL